MRAESTRDQARRGALHAVAQCRYRHDVVHCATAVVAGGAKPGTFGVGCAAYTSAWMSPVWRTGSLGGWSWKGHAIWAKAAPPCCSGRRGGDGTSHV